MIGVGVVYDNEWVQFDCHIADSLDMESELKLIKKWFAGMREVREKFEGDEFNFSSDNLIVHYSAAEKIFLKSAQKRHAAAGNSLNLPPLKWCVDD